MSEEAVVEREDDFEDEDLVEAYLDGALAPPHAERVAARLARDPGLAAALRLARDARAARQAVWASGEPGQVHADAVAARSIAAAVRQEQVRRAVTFARRATAAAAAVVLAFAGGWVARGRVAPADAPAGHRPAGDDRRFASSGAGDGPSFPVALTDENGNIIAVQQFDDPGSARQFAEDVDRWQSRPVDERGRAADHYVPVSGEF